LEDRKSKGAKPKVLSVGNCGFDNGNLGRVLAEYFGAEVQTAVTSEQAIHAVRDGQFDLVLVNRVFDANGDSGLELIKKLQSGEETRATPVMLVSNYADAQDAAIALGARPGFGKNALATPETRERLASSLKEQT
jgi:two-component system chemotaxis response regulator CheY